MPPKTNSQDSLDHGCRPDDPQAMSYTKKWHYSWCFHKFVIFELWAASIFSNDNGACWPKHLLFVMNSLTSYKYLHCHLNGMTAKMINILNFVPNGQKFLINKKHVFGQWNYMGVVSRLPVASPRHKTDGKNPCSLI